MLAVIRVGGGGGDLVVAVRDEDGHVAAAVVRLADRALAFVDGGDVHDGADGFGAGLNGTGDDFRDGAVAGLGGGG